MDANKEIVTKFFQSTTLEDRRKLNRSGIFAFNISDVVSSTNQKLEGSPLTLNYPSDVVQIIADKIIHQKSSKVFV